MRAALLGGNRLFILSGSEGRSVRLFAAFSFDFDLHKHKPKADGLNNLRKNPVIRHSERSEESLFSLANIREGFLASLGMTELVHFSAAC